MSRLSLAFVAVLAVGCLPPPQVCTDLAAASLDVRVVSDGAAIVDATVTASHDGGPAEACEAGDGGSYLCPFFEVEGDFFVTAARAGFVEESAEVTVGGDECHVITQQVVLELVQDAVPCCCAFIRPGDIDIISEEPTATAAECEARDAGQCIDPTGRFTPHACCPAATGDRCE